ncbi:MAG: hypothetical protein NTX76_03770 [Alphaproteobacteria bacterium]|nr:hypothetical protein [Alphaproteobacteria bacterium]
MKFLNKIIVSVAAIAAMTGMDVRADDVKLSDGTTVSVESKYVKEEKKMDKLKDKKKLQALCKNDCTVKVCGKNPLMAAFCAKKCPSDSIAKNCLAKAAGKDAKAKGGKTEKAAKGKDGASDKFAAKKPTAKEIKAAKKKAAAEALAKQKAEEAAAKQKEDEEAAASASNDDDGASADTQTVDDSGADSSDSDS